jgi:hypothetical protein
MHNLPSKKHLARDIDEPRKCKEGRPVYSLKDWNKLPPSQKCKRCVKEKAKQKKPRLLTLVDFRSFNL